MTSKPQQQSTEDQPGASSLGPALAALGLGGAALLASRAIAGPLTPPGGPVSSTHKTLVQVEPRTALTQENTPGDATAVLVITQPGSYYLTGNVSVPANKSGIRVAATDVSIDLNGFTISANDAAGTTGITDSGAGMANVSICNGVIERTANYGVFLIGQPTRLSRLTLRGHGKLGALLGTRARLDRVLAFANGAAGGLSGGIYASGEAAFIGCVATQNTGVGLTVGAFAVVRGCLALQNTGNGIAMGFGGIASNCESTANAIGFECQAASVLHHCVAQQNRAAGFQTSWAAAVSQCTANNNAAEGFLHHEGCALVECTTSGNTGPGIKCGQGVLVTRSTASFGGVAGIDLTTSPGSLVSDCVARNNGNSGIAVSGQTLVRGNNCVANAVNGPAAAGIYAIGGSNRIEDNHCAPGAGYGIWVNAQRNMVVNNTCGLNNLNYSISSNCIYGPVVNRTGLSVSGMSGNGTVATTMGTTDPFANIAF